MNNQEAIELRKYEHLDEIISKLLKIKEAHDFNYEPYNVKQLQRAIRAVLNVRGLKNIKAFEVFRQ